MLLTRQVKSVARVFLHQAGGLSGIRFWNRNTFRILMYHDFPSIPGQQESLAKQCAHIARYYEIVTLTDIGRYLREGKPLPKNALAVTVDDGNRDFLLNGYPVFRAHKIPVTVFLVSGFLDGQLWLWWDQIRYAVEQSIRTSFELSLLPGQPAVTFELSTDALREQAISTLAHAMRILLQPEREQTLRELCRQLGVELPKDPPPHLGPMTWAEVRQIADDGITIGAHTVTHPVMSRLKDPQELLREVAQSKKRIEDELHRPVSHFCYPYGLAEDYNDACAKVVEDCRFLTSVTAEHGLNNARSHPFKLRRLAVDSMLPEFYFQERLAGLHEG